MTDRAGHSRRGHRGKLILVAMAASLAIGVLGAAAAVASWQSSGTGSAGAQAKNTQALTVAPGTTTAQLYPGGSGDLVFTVTNPNPYPVSVSSIAAGSVGSIGSTAGVPCTGTGTGISYVLTTKTTGLGQVIAANNGTFTFTITNGVNMSNSSDASCAGTTFTIPVTVTGASAAGSTVTSPNNATLTLP